MSSIEQIGTDAFKAYPSEILSRFKF